VPSYYLKTLRACAKLPYSDSFMKEGLFSIEKTCQYLGGISRWTVYRLLREKAFPRVKIGKRIFIEKCDLDIYIDKEKIRR